MTAETLDPGNILLVRAIKFAVDKHGLQADKAGKPYILHPFAVMLNMGITTADERMVAVLHDVLEDTATTKEELLALFPQIVVDAVVSLTRLKGETYKEYLARVKMNPLAIKIKLADISHNMSRERMINLPKHEQVGLSRRYKDALEYMLKD